MDRRSISMFLDEEGITHVSSQAQQEHMPAVHLECSAIKLPVFSCAVKRDRIQRRTSNGSAVSSSTPPIPEEPEDMDSDDTYANDQAASPPQRQPPPPPSHNHHNPPARTDTRPHFREPPLVWQPERPAIATGGAQYPGKPVNVTACCCMHAYSEQGTSNTIIQSCACHHPCTVHLSRDEQQCWIINVLQCSRQRIV